MRSQPDKLNSVYRNWLCVMALLVISALPVGCGKRMVEVHVDVFVVTRSGESIKLGLVEVAALPYHEVTNAIERVASQRAHALADLGRREDEFKELMEAEELIIRMMRQANEAVQSLGNALDAAVAAGETYAGSIRGRLLGNQRSPNYSAAQQQVQSFESRLDLATLRSMANNLRRWDVRFAHGKMPSFEKVVEILTRDVWKGLASHQTNVLDKAMNLTINLDDLVSKSKELNHEIAQLAVQPSAEFREKFRREREGLVDSEEFLRALPAPVFTAKTDADGRCKIRIEGGQRWVLSAFAQRQVPGVSLETEKYVWIVPVVEANEKPLRLLLSNDNLLRSGANPTGF